jgi:metal-sulfur cluster biosynthetic enzyme
MTKNYSQDELFEILQAVEDPELGYSIVDLGLVYRAEHKADHLEVDVTLTYIGCPLEGMLKEEITRTLRSATGIEDVRVQIVWDPPWSMERASAEIRLDYGYAIW